MFIKNILLCFTTIVGVRGIALPVQKCILSDSDCLKTEFQKALPVFMGGIKEYGVIDMDPLFVELVQFDLAGLQFSYTNATMTGLKNVVIETVSWDTKRQQFSVAFHFTTGIANGHYTAAGALFAIPISGDGVMTFHVDGLQIFLTMPYDLVKGSDGKDYVQLRRLELDYETKENPRFLLTNLFDGNKELSDRMHAFIHEHWRPLAAVFGRPVALAAFQIVHNNIQNFFKKVPLSDIAE